jgi:hypothetical protein
MTQALKNVIKLRMTITHSVANVADTNRIQGVDIAVVH